MGESSGVKPRSGARAFRLPLGKLGVAQAVGAAAPWPERRVGKAGAAQGIRTLDLRITNALLYQLS